MSRHSRAARPRLTRLAALIVAGLAVVVAAGVLTCPVPGSGPGPSAPRPAVGPSVPVVRPGPIHVLGLGDSVTYGTNCDCRDYIAGFGTLLEQQDKVAVTVENEGDPGATTQDLADEITNDRGVRREIRQADIIVITVGANDLSDSLDRWRSGGCDVDCYQPSIDAMSGRLLTLLNQVRVLHTNGPTQVLVTNYWNVFTDGQVAQRAENAGYLAWSDRITQSSNAAICQAADRAQSTCVDLYHAFKPDPEADPTKLLSGDGDHPDAAGTALISRTVLEALNSRGVR